MSGSELYVHRPGWIRVWLLHLIDGFLRAAGCLPARRG